MITLSNIELLRGGKPLLQDASATINPGHKVALVGKNGCGKSTLFALLRGELSLDSGTLSMPGQWQIASVAQETPALPMPAIEYVIDGDQEYRQIQQQLAVAEEQGNGTKVAELHGQLDTIGGYSIYARAGELLAGLGFDTPSQSRPVSEFSGGWRMRLNLAQALLCRSDLLLLDEPTNHLDLDTVIWLERWLRQYAGTLILISHDREFIDAVVGKVIHIENNKLNEYTGDYSSFEGQRAEKLAQQQAMHEKQNREIAHMQKYIDRFRYKASKARQAQSRIKALEKMERILPAHVDSQFSFGFREPDSLPHPLLTSRDVSAGYGDLTILQKIQFNLVPGSRIGLLGRNGAGKSTLMKLLAGVLEAQTGELELNQNAKIGYFTQHQVESLHFDDTPLQHMVRLAPEKTELELRNFLGGFGFHGDKALEPVGPFSGGEKSRLALALLVWQKPNLLLMDEPTNHLDLDMRTALTMALTQFEGAMVVISHDRHLLQTTTEELYLVDNGKVAPFQGDLQDYQRWLSDQQKSAAQPEAAQDEPKGESRKEQKQREAELRRQTQPLRRQIEKLDKQMEKAQGELAAIEDKMSDNSLYEAENKARLNDLIQQQASLKDQLEEWEMEWLDANEQLEAMLDS